MKKSRLTPFINTGSEYPLIKSDHCGTGANKGQAKPENFVLWFPSGNAAVVRREAFLDAVEQVLARDEEFASKISPENIVRRYK